MAGGGGGLSGTIVLPAATTDVVADWLDKAGTDNVTDSLTTIIDSSITGVKDVCHNGGFDSYSGWEPDAAWAIAGGVATHTPAVAADDLVQPNSVIGLIDGELYFIQATVSNRTAGTVFIYAGSTLVTTLVANGTVGLSGTAADSATYGLVINASIDFDGDIDDVSVSLVSGNPYVGVSAYSPDTELANVVDNINSLRAVVEAYFQDIEWDEGAEKAGDRADTEFSSTTMDTRVSAIVDAALASMTKLTNIVLPDALNKSISNMGLISDEAVTKVSSVISSAADEVISILGDSDKFLDKSYETASEDTATEISKVLDKALATCQNIMSIVNTDSESKGLTAMTNIYSDVSSRVDSLVGSAVDKAVAKIGGAGGLVANGVVDVSGKIATEIATELSTSLTTALSQIASLHTRSLTNALDLSVTFDAESRSVMDSVVDAAIDKVMDKVGGSSGVVNNAFSRVSTEVNSEITTQIATILNKTIELLGAGGIKSLAGVDSIASKADTLSSSYISTLVNNAVDNVLSAVSGSDKLIESGYSSTSNLIAAEISKQLYSVMGFTDTIVDSGMDKALAKVNTVSDSLVTSVNTDISNIVDNAVTKLEAIVNKCLSGSAAVNASTASTLSQAISAAVSSLSMSAISDAVDAYETRRTPGLMRSMNRFTGPMADIGAVNSSAFIIGLSLIEAEFNADVDKYDSDLSLRMYSDMLASYIDLFKSTLSDYIRNLVSGVFSYVEAHSRYYGVRFGAFERAVAARVDVLRTIYGGYNDMFKSGLAEYISANLGVVNKYMDSYDRLSGYIRQDYATELGSFINTLASTQGHYGETFRAGLSSYIQSSVPAISDYINSYGRVSRGLSEDFFRQLDSHVRTLTLNQSEYGQSFRQTLSEYIRAGLANSESYIGAALSQSQVTSEHIKGLIGNQLEAWRYAAGEYSGMFKVALSEYLRAHISGLGIYQDTYKNQTGLNLGMLTDLIRDQLEAFNVNFDRHLASEQQRDRSRAAVIAAGSSDIMRAKLFQQELVAKTYEMADNYHKGKIALEKEEQDRNLELDVLDATWDLQVYQYGFNALSGAVGGAGYVPSKPSNSNVAGGVFSGAASGAMIGSNFGAPGALVGAGIGALLGGIAGGTGD